MDLTGRQPPLLLRLSSPPPSARYRAPALHPLPHLLFTRSRTCSSPASAPASAVVCNTPESLALSLDIYELVPRLLSRVHSHTGGPFGGESSLHIAVVNKHEDLLIKLLSLAVGRLDPFQVSGRASHMPSRSALTAVPSRTAPLPHAAPRTALTQRCDPKVAAICTHSPDSPLRWLSAHCTC